MARLNIDDEFFLDPRLTLLARKLTHRDDEVTAYEVYQAIGMCVKFWSVAQSYWRRGIEVVPAELVSEFGFDRLVEVGLAENREGGIYCKGASHHFKWLVDSTEKATAAGHASARARREKFGNAIPSNASNSKTTRPRRTQKSSSEISSARTSEQPPPNSPNDITLALTPDITLAPTLDKRRVPPPSEVDLEVGSEWFCFALKEMPWTAPPKGWNEVSFAQALVKVRQKTNLNDDGIRQLFKFIDGSDFWRRNALSPIGLLTVGKNGIRKIDTILSQMKPKEDKTDRALRAFAADPTPVTEELPF